MKKRRAAQIARLADQLRDALPEVLGTPMGAALGHLLPTPDQLSAVGYVLGPASDDVDRLEAKLRADPERWFSIVALMQDGELGPAKLRDRAIAAKVVGSSGLYGKWERRHKRALPFARVLAQIEPLRAEAAVDDERKRNRIGPVDPIIEDANRALIARLLRLLE